MFKLSQEVRKIKEIFLFVIIFLALMFCSSTYAQEQQEKEAEGYKVGIGDILEVKILKPDEFSDIVTVAPDGSISVPYIGSIRVKGQTIFDIQKQIHVILSDGYMKYPVVVVTLKESRSRRFFVYGEVANPGAYNIEENMTVLRAISVAGGFTKFGSSSKVKLMRPRKNLAGYEVYKIDMRALMEGELEEDIIVNPEDIIVVLEGVFK